MPAFTLSKIKNICFKGDEREASEIDSAPPLHNAFSGAVVPYVIVYGWAPAGRIEVLPPALRMPPTVLLRRGNVLHSISTDENARKHAYTKTAFSHLKVLSGSGITKSKITADLRYVHLCARVLFERMKNSHYFW